MILLGFLYLVMRFSGADDVSVFVAVAALVELNVEAAAAVRALRRLYNHSWL